MKLKGNKKWFLEQIQSRPFFLSLATAGQCQYWKGSLGNFELFFSTDTQTLQQHYNSSNPLVIVVSLSWPWVKVDMT